MALYKKLLTFALITLIVASTQLAGLCASKIGKKEIEVETKDAHIMKATLTYPKTDKKHLPTIVLLHSLGYSSAFWDNLIPELNNSGYAVLAIDLRGHGKSIYNSAFQQRSWVYFKPKAYQKYPADVVSVINQAQKQSKKISPDNWGIIGADIGANTAVLVAKQMPKKPKAMVLISPSMTFKGLYIPVAMTEIGCMPIFAIASQKDSYSLQEQEKVSKFAQGDFYIKNYPQGGMGMLMLKANPTMAKDIVGWLKRVNLK